MISLVVPTFNERPNIETLVARTQEALVRTGEPFELIIVDDNSPDGTAELIRSLQVDRPWLKLLVRTKERGLSTAVLAGWAMATGDLVGCMDADLQHPPDVLYRLYGNLRSSKADIAVASRHVPGGGVSDWNLARRFVSWTATLLATIVLPGTLAQVRDPMSGFFLLRRSVLCDGKFRPLGYKILLEVIAHGDYGSIVEVPYTFEERVHGGSKIGTSTMWQYLIHLGRISWQTGEAARVGKFALVGLSGAVVNLLCYRWLRGEVGLSSWAAAAGSALIAVCNNFIWNERLTFADRHRAVPGWRNVLKRFGSFAALSTAGLGINVVVVTLMVLLWKASWMESVSAGVIVAGLWNFATMSNITWRPWQSRKRTAHSVPMHDAALPVDVIGGTPAAPKRS